MAGHSKWANIKHRKAGQDAKRGKIFTKIIRELTVAARQGGGVVADNPRLRGAVDKALSVNMSKDTIERAIERGSGPAENDNLEELSYEGYGPAGVAILLETLTDNKNRTVADVRNCFSRHGGNLGTNGSVAYLFTRTGVISYPKDVDEEKLMNVALKAGAEDIINHDDGSLDVHTAFENFGQVKDALDGAGLEAGSAEVTMLASTEVNLSANDAEKLLRLVEQLEDLDDVQSVYSNANFSEAVMNQLNQAS
jgi:YebC/PmpR family DNA-binding regulatory protein